MNKLLFFIVAFFCSGVVFSQDSAERNAISKQKLVNNTPNLSYSDKSNLNQTAKVAVSTNATDSIPHQTTGDYREKKRFVNGENAVVEEPK